MENNLDEADWTRPFETEIDGLEKFLDELVDWLVQFMADGVKSKLKPYRSERLETFLTVNRFQSLFLAQVTSAFRWFFLSLRECLKNCSDSEWLLYILYNFVPSFYFLVGILYRV